MPPSSASVLSPCGGLIVPGIAFIFPDLAVVEASADTNAVLAVNASPEQLFNYAKSIGIGGIAMAGIIGVIKSWGVIKSAFGLVGKIFKGGAVDEKVARTQRDLSMKIIAIGSLLTLIVTTLFFYFDVMGGSLLFTVVGILIVAVISFLFTTVAANAIAIVGSQPRKRYDTDDTDSFFNYHGARGTEKERVAW